MTVCLLVVLPSVASAAQVDVKVCASITTTYADVHDDYLNGVGPYAARGVYMLVEDQNASFVDLVALEEDGADKGCATLSLDSALSHTVELMSVGNANDNFVSVKYSNGDYESSVYAIAPQASPTTVSFTVSATQAWDVYIAQMYAWRRAPLGLSGEAAETVIATCPGQPSGTNCFYPSDQKLYISPGSVANKYVVIHEMGHWLQWKKAGVFANISYLRSGNTVGNCADPGTGHDLTTEEWQSAAIVEGMAHYYPTVVFNDVTESDCGRFEGGDVVDDHFCFPDLFPPSPPNPPHICLPEYVEDGTYHCDQAGNGDESDDRDYWGQRCSPGAPSSDNVGTSLDWQRILWDLTTKQVGSYPLLTPRNIFEVYDAAAPDTWSNSTLSFGTPGNAASEMYDAAISEGYGVQWLSQIGQGAHR